ncbi:hypothetical protein [Silvimonas sp.]|uniref:hypothetical protein n=1 Tax=Silvimonas sp. TaxID=2650811 RepID=UPI00284D6928|nr:hypothetical protein [Silvimonas sp.]MDR3427843.1 hypothetical protein [Silvimonas sp.]
MMLAEITWTQLGEIVGALAALATIGTLIYAVAAGNRKTTVKVDQDPTPEFRKAPKRYNHDATEIRFVNLESKVGDHGIRITRMEERQRTEMTELERRLDNSNETRASETRQLIIGMNAANEERATAIHNRVNDILESVGELRGEMKAKK